MLQAIAPPDALHVVMDIVSPLAIAAGAWVGLRIRAAITDLQLTHEKAASATKAELVAQAAEIKRNLDVHLAEDKLQFMTINSKLDHIERTGAKA